ncbi:uncharacterized protein LOC121430867 isoform X2 [Lytechinus variegatus]|uniref:uncharacterized protein LOC121430867 isoform X2 n=1 Tax=Lytechinus variegatus TaxID=7654 RepID=UPI001BB10558|nr:uncharacterized protein LOC121430867 isoform X2 [Lytechinus variegatus]
MEQRKLMRRRIISIDTFAVLVVCTVGCWSSASGEGIPDKTRNITVTWGYAVVNIPCSEDYDLSTQKTIFWKKNESSFVTRFNEGVKYTGANSNLTKLNDDGSLSLRSDYRAAGKYECVFVRPNMPNKSYAKTWTTVRVKEPPLRVKECNTTDNGSSTCKRFVPNGTETLRFTLIKGGVGATSNITFKVDQSTDDIGVEEEGPMNKTDNDDGSVTITNRYGVDVTGLVSTTEIQFLLVDGQRTEEYRVVLMKADERIGDAGPQFSAGKAAGIAFGVIACVIVCIIVIGVIVWRKRKLFYRQARIQYNPPTVEI